MKYSREAVSRLVYLAGITTTMMGLVLEGIFVYMIGYPYWMERDMAPYRCMAVKRELLNSSMTCQTSEKGRIGHFPCYRISVTYEEWSSLPLPVPTTPAPHIIDASHSVRRHLNVTKSAVLFQSYFEFREASGSEAQCAVAPCNVSTAQNVEQAQSFVRQYGRLNGRWFKCYRSVTFDPNVVLVNLLTSEVPALPHLLSWPLAFASLGIMSIIVNLCMMGCSVWGDAPLV